jgi:catalase
MNVLNTTRLILMVLVIAASLNAQGETLPKTDPATFPVQAVDALNAVFGRHPGMRASHAKGICATGVFTATREAAGISKAPHFSGKPVKVDVRFSVGGGNPKVSDKAPVVRGIAIRFNWENGTTDLLAISAPMFFAATPEGFLGFLQARVPDPTTGKPNPDKIKAFNEAHPQGKAQPEYLAKTAPSASYATSRYWANHAFKFTNAAGESVYGRYILEPVAGVVGITEEQKQTLPDEFLADELKTRVAAGPVAFDLYLQLAESVDSLTDPTTVWPESRRRVRLGRLEIDKVDDASPGTCDRMMFNPTALPDGIEPSDDPILKARIGTYAVSLERRLAP